MDSVSFLPSFLKMLFSLAVVLGLLIGAMYLCKRFLHHTAVGAANHTVINILATRYLGPKCSIMLLDVLGNVLVVGVSNNQMSHLATLSDPDILIRLKNVERQEKGVPPLADFLKNNRVALRILDSLGKVSGKE